MRKHLRELTALAESTAGKMFVNISVTSSNHYRIHLANGRSVVTGSTPSDVRTIRHVRTNIRKQMEK